jgi:hypothetical protein
VFLFAIVGGCLTASESFPAATTDIEEAEAFAVLPITGARPAAVETEMGSLRYAMSLAACKVAPLTEIEDHEALEFERGTGPTGAVDVDGLMPAMARALESFKELVNSVGGTFELKSAYRPPAYQAHLQEVWLKWVKELRNNRTAGCRALREEVGAEFARHQLLVRQQPVSSSDHVLGLAFDASVIMPYVARLRRKRVSVDRLALLAGIKRPNSRRDPVHFKLVP